MAKIICPNKQYSGVSASVRFVDGVGETDSPNLIDWFKSHGYEIEQIESKDPPPDDNPQGDGVGDEDLKNDDTKDDNGDGENAENGDESKDPPPDETPKRGRRAAK